MGDRSNLLSRRGFFTSLAGFATGAVLGNQGSGLVYAQVKEPPKWPWPYKKLDAQAVAKMASDLYATKSEFEQLKKGGKFTGYNCTEAAFEAIMTASGCPPIPTAIETAWGGGVAGWQCMCGALAACIDAIGVFHGRVTRGGKEKTTRVAQNMMDWFTKNAGAPCCHVSVTTRAKNEGWYGKKWGCPEHLYSCALWAGRCVEHVIELLNDEANGRLKGYRPPDYTKGCKACHSPMSGVSDCFACHDKESHLAKPHTSAPVSESIRTPKQPNYLIEEKGFLRKK
jgi:C_GCAxxG_C_C family probable redox protein